MQPASFPWGMFGDRSRRRRRRRRLAATACGQRSTTGASQRPVSSNFQVSRHRAVCDSFDPRASTPRCSQCTRRVCKYSTPLSLVGMSRQLSRRTAVVLCISLSSLSQSVIGPILWGHSGPLCHALSLLSLLWTSILHCHSPGVATVACRLRYS